MDLCHERIIAREWAEDGRIPSVRELGMELKVNAHTALKAYDMLQTEGVIVQRRGLGFFLTPDARRRVMDARRSEFIDEQLPALFARMDTLGLTIEDIVKQYNNR